MGIPRLRNAIETLIPLFIDFEQSLCETLLNSMPEKPTMDVFDHIQVINHKITQINNNINSAISDTLHLREQLRVSLSDLMEKLRELEPLEKKMEKVKDIELKREATPHWLDKKNWTCKDDFWRYLREYDRINPLGPNAYAIPEQEKLIMTIYHYLRDQAKQVIESNTPNTAALRRNV